MSVLLDLWKFGHEYGGVEVDIVGAIARHATQQERKGGRAHEAQEVARTELTEPTDVIWFAEQLMQSGSEWQGQALIFVETKLKEVERALVGKRQDFTASHTADIYRRWLGENIASTGRQSKL